MISRVAVVVPAADEEDHIGDCLAALATARRKLRHDRGIDSLVVVVLDDCRDGTAALVAQRPDVATVVSSARCVGVARRLGASYALGLARPAREVWLANTDADCRVPADWLTRMVDEARHGAQLVLGTVRPAPGLPHAVERAWTAAHQVRDGHPHVHGANLGVAGDTYLALGGWRGLAAHEDVDLVERAAASGHVRISRCGAIPVVASSRLRGRARHGFADYLNGLHAS